MNGPAIIEVVDDDVRGDDFVIIGSVVNRNIDEDDDEGGEEEGGEEKEGS